MRSKTTLSLLATILLAVAVATSHADPVTPLVEDDSTQQQRLFNPATDVLTIPEITGPTEVDGVLTVAGSGVPGSTALEVTGSLHSTVNISADVGIDASSAAIGPLASGQAIFVSQGSVGTAEVLVSDGMGGFTSISGGAWSLKFNGSPRLTIDNTAIDIFGYTRTQLGYYLSNNGGWIDSEGNAVFQELWVREPAVFTSNAYYNNEDATSGTLQIRANNGVDAFDAFSVNYGSGLTTIGGDVEINNDERESGSLAVRYNTGFDTGDALSVDYGTGITQMLNTTIDFGLTVNTIESAFGFFRVTGASGDQLINVGSGVGGVTMSENLDVEGIIDTTGGINSIGHVVVNSGADSNDLTVLSETSGTTLFADSSTSRVGIGTNAPTVNLDVLGSSTATARVRSASSSSLAALGLFHAGTEKWTMYAPGSSNDLRFYSGAGGGDRVTVTSAGNLTAVGALSGASLTVDNLTADGSTITNGSGSMILAGGSGVVVSRQGSTNATLTIGETSDTTSYLILGDPAVLPARISWISTLLDIDVATSSTSSNLSNRIGRAVNTSGSYTTDFFLGDNTSTVRTRIDHKAGTVATSGGVSIGNSSYGGGPIWVSGTGSPEGVVTGVKGSLYSRTNGGAGTCLYVKESASGNTGWVPK
jgi:hypothetical protein